MGLRGRADGVTKIRVGKRSRRLSGGGGEAAGMEQLAGRATDMEGVEFVLDPVDR